RRTPPAGIVVAEPTWQRVCVPEQFDFEAISRSTEIWEQRVPRHMLIELDTVKFIDSSAMGLLLRLHKRLRQAGRRLVVLEPSQVVQRALKVMRLDKLFLIAGDILEAREVIQASNQELAAPVALPPSSSRQPLAWQGEITRHNARRVWQLTKNQIRSM